MPRVSVVIPAYHSESTVRGCLLALRAQSFRDFEVIVVNSSSPGDAIAAIIQPEFPEVRLIQSDVRLLPHAARNRGVEDAKGEILTFTDPDCRPRPDWLHWIVNAVDQGHLVVGGPILAPKDHARTERAIHLARFPVSLGSRSGGPEPARDLPTANATYSRSAWNAIGPFDGRFSCGDSFIALAANESGFRPWFEPRAVTEHIGKHRLLPFFRERYKRGKEFAWARWSRGDRSRSHAAANLFTKSVRLPRAIVRTGIAAREVGYGGEWLATLPLQIAGQALWSLGEAAGTAEQALSASASAPPAALTALPTVERRVVIVGAGPAGLAVAACLARGGVRATLLERGERPGASWSGHYEALRLHTTAAASALPHLDFPSASPRYPTRQDVLDYLQRYQDVHDLDVRCGKDVSWCSQSARGWQVEAGSERFEASHLIVAAGFNRVPWVPTWAHQPEFRGDLLHASRFSSGAGSAGRRALVVGMGNSGADIALDLMAHGASVTIAQQSPVFWIPKEPLGINWRQAFDYVPGAAFFAGRKLGKLAGSLGEVAAAHAWHGIQEHAFGGLVEHGVRLETPAEIQERWRRRRPPLTVDELAPAIRDGKIRVRPGVVALQPSGARFADGTTLDVDLVVLATGYRPGIEMFLDGASSLLDAEGVPLAEGAPAAGPGLFFCGYRPELRGIGESAQAIARAITGVSD